MYRIDFHKPIHIHFIGIGGISMSGLPRSFSKKASPYPAQIPKSLR